MNKLLQTTAIALMLTVPGFAYAQSTTTGTDTNTQTQTDATQPATGDTNTQTQTDATQPATGGTNTQTQTDATQPATGGTNMQSQTDAMQPATEGNTTATQTPATTATGDSETGMRSGPASFLAYDDAEGRGALRASNLIGMRVYAVEQDVDPATNYDATARKDWEDIGEVNDVIVSWDGNVRGVILGVGGFLGLGEKDVAIDMSSLRRVRETNDSNDWFLVVNSSKTALESAPSYKPAS